MDPRLARWQLEEPPSAQLGLDLTLSLVGDHPQHVDRKHWNLLVCRLCRHRTGRS
jgi:hypothetical protein